MATTTTKLQMKFGTMSGVKTFTVNYVNPDARTADIKALMDTIITNGSIYTYPPLTKESAELITTETTEIDIS